MFRSIPKNLSLDLSLPPQWTRMLMNVVNYAILFGALYVVCSFVLGLIHGLFPGALPTYAIYTFGSRHGILEIMFYWKACIFVVGILLLEGMGISTHVEEGDNSFHFPKLIIIAINSILAILYITSCIIVLSGLQQLYLYWQYPAIMNPTIGENMDRESMMNLLRAKVEFYRSYPINTLAGELKWRFLFPILFIDPILVIAGALAILFWVMIRKRRAFVSF